MMTRKETVPVGWPCTLVGVPPGLFVTLEDPDSLCFKSEYRLGGAIQPARVEALNSGGGYFHGKGNPHMVQPVEMVVVVD